MKKYEWLASKIYDASLDMDANDYSDSRDDDVAAIADDIEKAEVAGCQALIDALQYAFGGEEYA